MPHHGYQEIHFFHIGGFQYSFMQRKIRPPIIWMGRNIGGWVV